MCIYIYINLYTVYSMHRAFGLVMALLSSTMTATNSNCRSSQRRRRSRLQRMSGQRDQKKTLPASSITQLDGSWMLNTWDLGRSVNNSQQLTLAAALWIDLFSCAQSRIRRALSRLDVELGC